MARGEEGGGELKVLHGQRLKGTRRCAEKEGEGGGESLSRGDRGPFAARSDATN